MKFDEPVQQFVESERLRLECAACANMLTSNTKTTARESRRCRFYLALLRSLVLPQRVLHTKVQRSAQTRDIMRKRLFCILRRGARNDDAAKLRWNDGGRASESAVRMRFKCETFVV
ncbi:MAG: hypothetical protein FD148_521 [Methylocystaceae bacterium]|nr:MAG: hypothetical protein FD148_521 [Methylocystaceae bacterium]